MFEWSVSPTPLLVFVSGEETKGCMLFFSLGTWVLLLAPFSCLPVCLTCHLQVYLAVFNGRNRENVSHIWEEKSAFIFTALLLYMESFVESRSSSTHLGAVVSCPLMRRQVVTVLLPCACCYMTTFKVFSSPWSAYCGFLCIHFAWGLLNFLKSSKLIVFIKFAKNSTDQPTCLSTYLLTFFFFLFAYLHFPNSNFMHVGAFDVAPKITLVLLISFSVLLLLVPQNRYAVDLISRWVTISSAYPQKF